MVFKKEKAMIDMGLDEHWVVDSKLAVITGARFGKKKIELRLKTCPPTCYLSHPNKSSKQFWTTLNDSDAQIALPGMNQQHNFLLSKITAQILGEFDPIQFQTVKLRRRILVLSVGPAGS